MLKFLLIPRYREAVAQAVMKKSYKPPYAELPDTDTIHHMPPNNPAVIAIDMDVKRIDRALLNAQNMGFERIAIYAMSEQIPFLKNRYGNTGSADVGAIYLDSLKGALDYNIELYKPPSELFISKEGRYFDASYLNFSGKVRKPN